MKRIPLLLVTLLAPACVTPPPADGDPHDDGPTPAAAADAAQLQTQRRFLARYAGYCGRSYRGRSVMVDLGPDHPLEGAALTMILERCTGDEVRIAFHVDGDTSRTWILTRTDRGLHLAHDHRYPDGTEYDANFYGGYADDRGTDLKQFFPADARTIGERPAREINVWSKEFDLEGHRYYYRLYLRGALAYEAEFDLATPSP